MPTVNCCPGKPLWPACGTVNTPLILRVPNDSGSSKSALASLLVVVAVIGGLALLGWFTVVLLDLKHLNTSGFTLP
jgi:hypothetical protein